MDSPDLALLRRLAENVMDTAAAGREVVDLRPFRAFLSPESDLVYLNYAVPVAPCEDWSAALAELRAAFEARGRVLRFEYFDALWPTLRPALEQARLTLELAAPVMALVPGELVPRGSPEVEVRVLAAEDPDADFALHAHLGAAGFQMPLPAPPEVSVPRDRARVAEGGLLAAIAWRRGEPAGAGSLLIGGEVGELAGVATVPAHRGRGVAAVLCSGLIAAGFARGLELAWLSAGDDPARALYHTLGFRHLGEQLNYGLRQLAEPVIC